MSSKHPSEDEQPGENIEKIEAAMLAAGLTGLGSMAGGSFPTAGNASGMSNEEVLGTLAMTGGIEGEQKPPTDEEIPPVDTPEEEI